MSSTCNASVAASDVSTISTTTIIFPPSDCRYRSGTVASFSQPGILVPEYTFALPPQAHFSTPYPSLYDPQPLSSIGPSSARGPSTIYSRTRAFTSRLSRITRHARIKHHHNPGQGPYSPPAGPRSGGGYRYSTPYPGFRPRLVPLRLRNRKALLAFLKRVLLVIIRTPRLLLKTKAKVTKVEVRRVNQEETELMIMNSRSKCGSMFMPHSDGPHTPLLQAFMGSTQTSVSPLTPIAPMLSPAQREELIEEKRMFSYEKLLQVLGEEASDGAFQSCDGYGLEWLEDVERERGERILDCVPSF